MLLHEHSTHGKMLVRPHAINAAETAVAHQASFTVMVYRVQSLLLLKIERISLCLAEPSAQPR